MIPFFPKQIATKAIAIYVGSLAIVSFALFSYAMSLTYIIMGVVWVVGFFWLTSYFSKKWMNIPNKLFLTKIGLTALGLRVVWVVFSYLFYVYHTGEPFEFNAADSISYWGDGAWLAVEKWSFVIDHLFIQSENISDSGYLFYLAALYKLIGPNIFLTRVIKCLWSTATVLLVYKIAKRNLGEECGRLSAVMVCFMPNLIIYCGLHLKETEMLFLIAAFLERTDYLLRSKRYNLWTIALPVALLLSLFTFRTVLGIAGAFAFASGLVFTSTSVIGRRKRTMLIVWSVLAVATFMGGSVRNEIDALWEERSSQTVNKRMEQTTRGNRWAKYATGSVMAPMMFVLPFPTMVDVDHQYNQQIMSGGNYVRNFLGGFVLLALFNALLIKKNWRDLSFLGAFIVAYLGIVSMSGFSNSERFLLPGLPGLLIMASYGITLLNVRNYRYIKIWYWIVPVMVIGWAVFKIGSRGLL